MLSSYELKKIEIRLKAKKPIHMGLEHSSSGELIKVEFFLKATACGYRVGFDHYLDKYEDATDLYEVYLRRDFVNLADALKFCIEALSITPTQMLGAS